MAQEEEEGRMLGAFSQRREREREAKGRVVAVRGIFSHLILQGHDWLGVG